MKRFLLITLCLTLMTLGSALAEITQVTGEGYCLDLPQDMAFLGSDEESYANGFLMDASNEQVEVMLYQNPLTGTLEEVAQAEAERGAVMESTQVNGIPVIYLRSPSSENALFLVLVAGEGNTYYEFTYYYDSPEAQAACEAIAATLTLIPADG